MEVIENVPKETHEDDVTMLLRMTDSEVTLRQT